MRRPLRLWLRSSTVHWAVALVLALLTLVSFDRRAADLARREARIGPLVEVVVVRNGHSAGERLGLADVEIRRVPAAIAPADAIRHPKPTRLTAPVSAGEVLTRARSSDQAASRLAATIPPRWRAVALAVPPAALRLSTGDRVELLAPAVDGTPVPIATGQVVDHAEGTVTVVVPADDVGTVAGAQLAGTLSMTLVGPDG